MTKNNDGDISKARRILRQLDILLGLTGDKSVFAKVHPDNVRALSNSLQSAETATKNILQILGEPDYDHEAPKQARRNRYTYFLDGGEEEKTE